MEIIAKKFTDKIRTTSKAKFRLSYEFDTTENTIKNWLDKNDEGGVTPLTTPMGLKAIAEELDVKKSELLTEA